MPNKTKQRDALMCVFQEAEKPLSYSEIHDAIKKIIPTTGRATTFRNMALFEKKGLIVRLPSSLPVMFALSGREASSGVLYKVNGAVTSVKPERFVTDTICTMCIGHIQGE